MASLRYRNPNSPRVLSVRVLKPEDLEFLRQKSCVPSIKKLRDSHHMIARLIALGLKYNEVAERCGYTPTRVSILAADPSVKELIIHYRSLVTESILNEGREIVALTHSLTLQSLRKLQDRYEEDDEAAVAGSEPGRDGRLRDRDLLTSTESLLDRTGHGKVSTNVNVNVNFADRLEAARRRVLSGVKAPQDGPVLDSIAIPTEAA